MGSLKCSLKPASVRAEAMASTRLTNACCWGFLAFPRQESSAWFRGEGFTAWGRAPRSRDQGAQLLRSVEVLAEA